MFKQRRLRKKYMVPFLNALLRNNRLEYTVIWLINSVYVGDLFIFMKAIHTD